MTRANYEHLLAVARRGGDVHLEFWDGPSFEEAENYLLASGNKSLEHVVRGVAMTFEHGRVTESDPSSRITTEEERGIE